MIAHLFMRHLDVFEDAGIALVRIEAVQGGAPAVSRLVAGAGGAAATAARRGARGIFHRRRVTSRSSSWRMRQGAVMAGVLAVRGSRCGAVPARR